MGLKVKLNKEKHVVFFKCEFCGRVTEDIDDMYYDDDMGKYYCIETEDRGYDCFHEYYENYLGNVLSTRTETDKANVIIKKYGNS